VLFDARDGRFGWRVTDSHGFPARRRLFAGADINEPGAADSGERKRVFAFRAGGVFILLETIGKPSICAINGILRLAAAAKLALFLHDSHRQQKPRSLASPKVKLGHHSRLWRLATHGRASAGKGVAHELCLTGRNDYRRKRRKAYRPGESTFYESAELLLRRGKPWPKRLSRKRRPGRENTAWKRLSGGVEMPAGRGSVSGGGRFSVLCLRDRRHARRNEKRSWKSGLRRLKGSKGSKKKLSS